MNPAVRTEVDDGVLTITLDRPKANAIDVTTSLALHAAFVRLQQDPALRVAIITGTGRFFGRVGFVRRCGGRGDRRRPWPGWLCRIHGILYAGQAGDRRRQWPGHRRRF